MDHQSYDIDDEIEINVILYPQDLFARPNLDLTVTTASVLMSDYRFINDYSFDEEVGCGLADCRRPHKTGLVGKLGDGRVFHVGHICGANKFDASFHQRRKKFERVREEKRLRKRMREFMEDTDTQLAITLQLVNQPQGARWVQEALKEWKRVTPETVRTAMRRKARAGETRVESTRKRSNQEIRDLLAAQLIKNRSEGEIEVRREGDLKGLEVLGADPHGDNKEVTTIIRAARAAEPDSLNLKQLKDWQRKIQSCHEAIQRMRESIAAARRFFTEQNLALQVHLALTDADQYQIANTRWDFAKPSATPPVHETGRSRTS